MGRLVTGANNPTVLYVSGGNTQVCASLFFMGGGPYEGPTQWFGTGDFILGAAL